MCPFKRRKALFREGARLHYLSSLVEIVWNLYGHAYEDVVSKRLAEIGRRDYPKLMRMKLVGKIWSDRTVWDYVGNAEAIGLVLTSGRSRVTRGGVRARYLSLTAFGEAVAFVRKTSAAHVDLPKLRGSEKLLYFKRFLEIDRIWDGLWFGKFLSAVPDSEFVDRRDLINRIAEATGLKQVYTPSAVAHRVSPKIEWSYDLDLIDVDQTRRQYKLTEKGARFLQYQKGYADPELEYETMAKTYDIITKPAETDTIQNTVSSVYQQLTSLYNSPPHYVSVATMRYLVGTLLLTRGRIVNDTSFDSAILEMRRSGQVDLTPSPPTSAIGEPIVESGERFDLMSVRS